MPPTTRRTAQRETIAPQSPRTNLRTAAPSFPSNNPIEVIPIGGAGLGFVGKGKEHATQNRLLVAQLRELRLSRGLTQADLAKRLDKPQSFVSKVERAERLVDAVELRQWCIALGVDVVKVVRDWSKRL
jgi:Helix-turn-helix